MDTTRRSVKSIYVCMWAVIACLLVNLSAFTKVNAINYNTAGTYNLTGLSATIGGNVYSGTQASGSLQIVNNNATGTMTNLSLSGGTIPAKSIFTITIRATAPQALYPVTVNGYGSNDFAIINQECAAQVNGEGGSQSRASDIICTIQAYTSQNLQTITLTGYMVTFPSTGAIIVVNKPTYITLGDEGASDIESAINQTTNAINNLNNQESQWRTNDQTSQEDANDEASNATDAVKDAVQSKQGLLDLFYDLIQVLTDTSATDCQVPFYDPATGSPTTINLCQGSGTPLLILIQSGASILATIWCSRAGVAWYHRFINELNEVSK